MCKIALAQEFKLLNLLRLQNVFRRQLGFVLGSEGGQNNSEENSAQGYLPQSCQDCDRSSTQGPYACQPEVLQAQQGVIPHQ